MIENSKKEVSILIVGAGPTGLLLGCRLLERGISCRVIEKRTERENSTRAIGVTASTLHMFSKMNLLEDFLKEAQVTDRIKFFWKGAPYFSIGSENHKEESIFSKFVYSTQPHIEKILEEKFISLGGEIEYGTELRDVINLFDGVQVFLKKNEVQFVQFFDYLIGCDGGQSLVRQKIDPEYEREDYKAFFCLADVELSTGQVINAEYFLTEEGYCMIIPLPRDKYRIIFSQLGTLEKDSNENLNASYFENIIEERSKKKIGVKKIIWKTSGPFRHQVVLNPIRDHMILAGDALHVFSPIGGTNMNVGLLDADKLSSIFEKIWSGVEPKVALNEYSENRKILMKKNMDITKKSTYLITRSKERDFSYEKNFIPNKENYCFLTKEIKNQFSLEYFL